MNMGTIFFCVCTVFGIAAITGLMYGSRQTVRCKQRYAEIVRKSRRSR